MLEQQVDMARFIRGNAYLKYVVDIAIFSTRLMENIVDGNVCQIVATYMEDAQGAFRIAIRKFSISFLPKTSGIEVSEWKGYE